LKGAGVAAVVVPSAPVGKLFAVPEFRLLGARVVLPAGVVPAEDVLPVDEVAFEAALVPLLEELDVLPLAAGAGAVVDGTGIERVVLVVVCAAAAPENASATASARARDW